MKTIEEKVEIYRAFLNGKQIEFTVIGQDYWEKSSNNPTFNWDRYDYRVKPEQTKQKVAYAFVAIGGAVVWRTKELIPDTDFMKHFARAAEFDIIAKEPNE